jgi:hypothetical protein
MNQPISIVVTPAGMDLILAGLNKLPREVSDPLFRELEAQFNHQLRQLRDAAAARLAEESKAKADADKAAKKASKAKKEDAPAAPAEDPLS